MRLGDLDALKKAIEELEITEELVDYDCDDVSTTGVSQYLDRPDVLDLIDNAPTVERPQGEWQYTTHHARRYRICPFCKCEKEDDRSAGWFYCWHCGAYMKGGTE